MRVTGTIGDGCEHMARLNFWLTFAGIVFVAVIGATYLYLVKQSPLPFTELDFDDNGLVTLGELLYANAYGTRTVLIDERECTEYYALGDHKRLKLSCD